MDTDVRIRRYAAVLLSLLLALAAPASAPVERAASTVTHATPFVEVANKKVKPPKKAKPAKKSQKAKKAKSAKPVKVTKPAAKPVTKAAAYTYHSGYVTPQDLWHVYAEPYATAKTLPSSAPDSPVVAVIESGSYAGGVYRDQAVFRQRFGLPACPQGTCFREVNEDGATAPLPPPDPAGYLAVRPLAATAAKPATRMADDVWWTEADLDVQAVSAVCPDCRIIVADADPSHGNAGLVAAVRAAVSLGAQYVSMSFGMGDVPGAAALFATPGVVFTAAPGDSGYGGAPLPAGYPNVISVGGLTFKPSADKHTMTFSAWSGTGSGCASSSRSVLGQLLNTVAMLTCGGAKAANDLSSLANPNTGLMSYLAGSWALGGGTSLSAPLIAGLYAVAGNHTDPSAIYAHAARFRDVTTGRNGSCAVRLLCTTASGWDAPTGLGTPATLVALAAGQ